MDINRIKALRPQLITPANPEWTCIVCLRERVQREFAERGRLSKQVYNEILDWKLRRQRGRAEAHREHNSDELIGGLTAVFQRVERIDVNVRLKILMAIPGTGIGVASAILTLSDPKRFAIIDPSVAYFSQVRRLDGA